jgi:hypothetical protein
VTHVLLEQRPRLVRLAFRKIVAQKNFCLPVEKQGLEIEHKMSEPESDIDTRLKKHAPCDGSGFSGNSLADDKKCKIGCRNRRLKWALVNYTHRMRYA